MLTTVPQHIPVPCLVTFDDNQFVSVDFDESYQMKVHVGPDNALTVHFEKADSSPRSAPSSEPEPPPVPGSEEPFPPA